MTQQLNRTNIVVIFCALVIAFALNTNVVAQDKADFVKFEIVDLYSLFSDQTFPASVIFRAKAINNRRDIAGGYTLYSFDTSSPYFIGSTPRYAPELARPYVRRGGITTHIALPPGASGAEVVKLNDSGDLLLAYYKPIVSGSVRTHYMDMVFLRAVDGWRLPEPFFPLTSSQVQSYLTDLNNSAVVSGGSFIVGLSQPFMRNLLLGGAPTNFTVPSPGGTIQAINNNRSGAGEYFIQGASTSDIVPALYTVNSSGVGSSQRIPPVGSGCESSGSANDVNDSGKVLITRRIPSTTGTTGSNVIYPILYNTSGLTNQITPATLRSELYPVRGTHLNNAGDVAARYDPGMMMSAAGAALFAMNEGQLRGFQGKLAFSGEFGGTVANPPSIEQAIVSEILGMNDKAEMVVNWGWLSSPWMNDPSGFRPAILIPHFVKGDHNHDGRLFQDQSDMTTARDCYYRRPAPVGVFRDCSLSDLNNDGTISSAEYSAMYRQYTGQSDGIWTQCQPPPPPVAPTPTPTPKP